MVVVVWFCVWFLHSTESPWRGQTVPSNWPTHNEPAVICGPTAPTVPSSKGLEVLRGGLAPVGKPKAGEGFVFFLFGWVKPILTSSCCCCGFKLLRVGTLFWDFRFSQVDKTSFEGFAFVSWWEIHGKCCHVWCFAMGENVCRIHPSWKRWMNGSSRQSPRRTRYHSDTRVSMKAACQRQPMHWCMHCFMLDFLWSHECLWRAETLDCSDQSLPSAACHGIDAGIPGQGDGVETHSWHLPPWFAPKSPAKQRGGGEDKFCDPCICFCKSVCLHSWGQNM